MGESWQEVAFDFGFRWSSRWLDGSVEGPLVEATLCLPDIPDSTAVFRVNVDGALSDPVVTSSLTPGRLSSADEFFLGDARPVAGEVVADAGGHLRQRVLALMDAEVAEAERRAAASPSSASEEERLQLALLRRTVERLPHLEQRQVGRTLLAQGFDGSPEALDAAIRAATN